MPKPDSQAYPPPLIFPPTSGTHKSTFIILHGRGSTAERFAEPLLQHTCSSLIDSIPQAESQTIRSHFPHTKFIFPTASRRRAAAYNRSFTHQWFDLYPLDQYPPEYKEHVQFPGLGESIEYLHGLLKEAVEDVGANNVVLMGLSQGCAVGLLSLLLWKGERLEMFVGMCGWLPLRKSMCEALNETGESDGDGVNPFECDDVGDEKSKIEQIVEWLQEELSISSQTEDTTTQKHLSILETLVFLGNGMEDEKVPTQLGKLATDFLKVIGSNVIHMEYPGLGHWYSEDMLRDIVSHLKNLKGAK